MSFIIYTILDIIFVNLKLKILNLNNYRLKTKGLKATKSITDADLRNKRLYD